MKPLLLDLFCGAGGASMGYYLAGFEVIGVDLKYQRNYPFTFIQGDAIEIMRRLVHRETVQGIRLSDIAAIHASPPCQFGTALKALHKNSGYTDKHQNLIPSIRSAMTISGKPFVIENVEGARRELRSPFMLCGTMFGLRTSEGSQLRRHRWFEYSWSSLILVPRCNHNDGSAIGVHGGGQHPARRRPATILVNGSSGGKSNRDNIDHYGVSARREAMGIDWTSGAELSQAIPPAYTKFIGGYLMSYLQNRGEL